MTGRDLGPYRVLEKLAQGGMGEVYRARDERLGRDVAVKLLPQEFLADSDRLRRFEQEARAAAALNHPNILSVHDIGTQDGVPYFVCELLKGETLRARLGRGPLTLKQVADYGAELARGLAAAHEHRIVHRDIKPENLFITADGRLKILDFGIAKAAPVTSSAGGPTATAVLLTEPGAIVGTVPYMSPEQVRGAPTDHRSDIFAAGAVLFEMLTGRRAFDAPSATEIMSAVLTKDPFTDADAAGISRTVLPPALVHIIKHCLEKDPRARFQSASDIAFGLDVLPGASDPPAAVIGPAPHNRRRARLMAAAAAIALALLAFVVWTMTRSIGRGAPSGANTSIATLPLANLGGNPADDYFADGMTESLITELARTPNLAVIARAAVFRYKEKSVDPQKAGQELGARYVVHGSVQRAGERVRVNVRLVDVSTGLDIIGEPFEGDVKDLFVLQDRISGRIVAALQLKLAPDARRSVRPPTTSEQGYDAYLQGIYYFHRSSGGSQETVDNLNRAIGFFEQAVSADPQFALAQARLGSGYSTRFFYFDPDRTWEQKAFVAIEKALAVDPDLAEAYVARGMHAWSIANGFPHERAVRDLQHAIALNPSVVEAHVELAKIYMHIGMLDKAVQENSLALRLDPNDASALGRRIMSYTYDRQCATSLQLLNQQPSAANRSARADALRCLGRTDEALQLFAETPPANASEQGLVAALLARKGDSDAARQRIDQARPETNNVEGLSHFHHAQYYIGAAYALMGETRQAVSWLRKATREGMPCYPLFERDSDLDNLRRDAEFAALMAELKAQHERFRSLF
jgi:serine/threonine protein kinase/tetratricopeptide (TPR) repeat protein